MTIINEINDILDDAHTLGLKHLADEQKARLLYCTGKDMSQCRVVVAGLYNSGKSSLLNALCNSLAEPYKFVIGDVPTTRNFSEQEYDGCVYVDTPGYGERQDTRERAALEWKTASVILFVRSLVNNTQQQEDFEELKYLCEILDNPQDRILVVLSKSGQINADDIPDSIAAASQYIKSEIDHALTVLCVDSHDYMEGKLAGEDRMVAQSGVEDVRAWIAQRKYMRCTYLIHAIASLTALRPPLKEKQKQAECALQALEKKKNDFVARIKEVFYATYHNILAPAWAEVFSCEKNMQKYTD